MGIEKYYTATKRLDIRSGPGDDFALWEKTEKGDEIIVPVTDGWLPVLMEDETGADITGWVNAKFLEVAPEERPAPPSEAPSPDFPIFQKNLRRMFGAPSYSGRFRMQNIANIDLSEFGDMLSHVKTFDGKPMTSIVGHKLLEKPLKKALGLVRDRNLSQEIKTYDGLWNIRAMRSGASMSVHSWGLALDFNQKTNPFHNSSAATWPKVITDFSEDFIGCFAEAGFEWGGLWKSVHDAMHFQLPWTQDWRASDAPLRPDVFAAPVTESDRPQPPDLPAAGVFDFTTKKGTMAAIKAECEKQGIGLPAQVAYVLATTEWETAHTFKPVREAFWKDEDWRKRNLSRYYPYYGRGYVQLTWEDNYRKYANILDIDLVNQPDLAMEPQTAMFILVHGFKTGAFTGKKITDYINEGKKDFTQARRCINRLDKAEEIADIAEDFLKA